MSWPGLEPRSSDSEPSALTTGPLDKAMALACLWYSWPRMLKVAPCTVIRSYGHTVVRSYGRTVVRSYGHMGVRSYNQIFLAWWVTTILYTYGATLCKSYFFLCMNQKLTKWSSREIEIEKEAHKKKSGMDRVQTIMWQAQVESLSKPGKGFFPNNYLDCSLIL